MGRLYIFLIHEVHHEVYGIWSLNTAGKAEMSHMFLELTVGWRYRTSTQDEDPGKQTKCLFGKKQYLVLFKVIF